MKAFFDLLSLIHTNLYLFTKFVSLHPENTKQMQGSVAQLDRATAF